MNRIILFLLILSSFIYSQTSGLSGNLIKIHVNVDTVNQADTLGYWVKDIGDVTSYYFNVIRTDSIEYLLRYEKWDPEFIPGHRKCEIEEVNTGARKKYSYIGFIDFVGPTYWITPNAYIIETGIWLFHDVFGHSFLSNSDTLYEKYYQNAMLYHISGKVDHRYFVMARSDDDLYFVLSDLSNSPEYNLSELSRLNFSLEDRPISLQKVSSDLFLIRIRDDLNLYSFEADTFAFIKTMLYNVNFDRFKYRNDSLYFKNDEGLIRYVYSSGDTNFIDKTILLEKINFIDYDFTFPLTIDKDSLYLYDIRNEREQKSWDISMLNNPHRPIMKYPNIYLHIERDTVKTSLNSFDHEFDDYIIFKAYPNPFNSSIEFLIKMNRPDLLEISIFDILGRKVHFENWKVITAGAFTYRWSPVNLSSGIYWIKIKTGNLYRQQKIIYLK